MLSILLFVIAATARPIAGQQSPSSTSVRKGNAKYWISADLRDTVRYRSPDEEEPINRILDAVKEGAVDIIVQTLQRTVHMPALRFTVRPCGLSNAFYRPRADEVLVCAELLLDMQRKQPASDGNPLRTAVHGTRFWLAHEIGHAVIARYNLPITGDEDPAADEFAGWMLARAQDWIGLMSASLVFRAMAQSEEWTYERVIDVHGLDAQRAARLDCWTNLRPGMNLSAIPRARADACAVQIARAQRSWTHLLEQYGPRSGGFRDVVVAVAGRTSPSGTSPTPTGDPPNTVRGVDGQLYPIQGYAWVDENSSTDFRVRRVAVAEASPTVGGSDGGQDPQHTVRGVDGQLYPVEGYAWVNPTSSTDLRVTRVPTAAPVQTRESTVTVSDRDPPNTVRGVDGQLYPIEGYDWVDPSSSTDLRVKRKTARTTTRSVGSTSVPGDPPNTVRGPDGQLYPIEGYDWVNPESSTDFRVKRVTKPD